MSTINVRVVKPYKIERHLGADKLDIMTIEAEGGFSCVIKRGEFSINDLVIYIPPDSMLPNPIIESLSKNKITIKDNRIRAIKIKGVVSEGLCLNPKNWLPDELIFNGSDVTEYLEIKKYVSKLNQTENTSVFKSSGTNIRYKNNNFIKYVDIERFEKRPKIFMDVPEIIITTKFHGSNWRSGIVEVQNLNCWQKIKKLFTFKKQYEFLVGSHEKIRRPSKKINDLYREDLYWRAALKYEIKDVCEDIKEKLKFKEIIFFGEVIGPRIQVGYEYGIEEGNIELRIFDIYADKKWISWRGVKSICKSYDLPIVEELYVGPWSIELKKMAEAVDNYNGRRYNREGVVIKDTRELHNRAVAKVINPYYLIDKKNSEFH